MQTACDNQTVQPFVPPLIYPALNDDAVRRRTAKLNVFMSLADGHGRSPMSGFSRSLAYFAVRRRRCLKTRQKQESVARLIDAVRSGRVCCQISITGEYGPTEARRLLLASFSCKFGGCLITPLVTKADMGWSGILSANICRAWRVLISASRMETTTWPESLPVDTPMVEVRVVKIPTSWDIPTKTMAYLEMRMTTLRPSSAITGT